MAQFSLRWLIETKAKWETMMAEVGNMKEEESSQNGWNKVKKLLKFILFKNN